eukprot:747022-Hanusia_phi.AAC.1
MQIYVVPDMSMGVITVTSAVFPAYPAGCGFGVGPGLRPGPWYYTFKLPSRCRRRALFESGTVHDQRPRDSDSGKLTD